MAKLDKYSTEDLFEAMQEARSSGLTEKADKLASIIEERQRTAPAPSDEKIMSPLEYGRALFESTGRGLTLGVSDFLPAIGAGVESLIKGDGFQKGYGEISGGIQARRKQLSEVSPSSSLLYELVPAMATGTGIARELSKRGAGLLQQVGAGAAEGATAGALTSQGDIGDRLFMGGLGATLGAGGYGLGALFPRVGEKAKDVMSKGIPLTVGQQRGAAPEFIEKTIESSLLDIPVGVAKSKLKGFEGFNRMIIEDAVKPLGVKFDENLAPEEIFTQAVRKTRDAFESAVNKVNLSAVNPMILQRKALNDPVNMQLIMDKFGLRPDEFTAYLNVLDNVFYRNILPKGKGVKAKDVFSKDLSVGEKEITGKRLSNAINQLNSAAQDAFDAGQGNLSKAIKDFRSDVLDQIQRRAKNQDDFIKARQAWSNMSSIRDASRGREIITPVDYENALFRRYGDTYRESAEYQKIKPIKDIIGDGGRKVSDEGQDRLIGLQTVQGTTSTLGGLSNVGLGAVGFGAGSALGASAIPLAIGTVGGLASGYRTGLGKKGLGLLYQGIGRGAEGGAAATPLIVTNE